MSDIAESNIGFKSEVDNFNKKIQDFSMFSKSYLDNLCQESKDLLVLEQAKDEMKNEIEISQTEVVLNVGGKLFYANLETLIKSNNSIFYTLILSKKVDYKKEIKINRSSEGFKEILDYLRCSYFDIDNYNYDFLKKIKTEALFYEIISLEELVSKRLSTIRLISYEMSAPFRYNNQNLAENDIKFLNNHEDKTGKNGFACTNNQGYFISFRFDRICKVTSIETMGYSGSVNRFSASNGSNAKILIGNNNKNWIEVGKLKSNHNVLQKIPLIPTILGNCIKFSHSNNIGIGYLKIYFE